MYSVDVFKKMNVITATEFRANQRKYFDLAEKEPVIVTRAGKNPISIRAIPLDQLPTKEELEAIKEGLQAYKEGNVTKIKDPNNIWESIL